MKYFLDTEFIEGTQKSIFNKPTIDLISIAMVCEDGREYYAISKDFNLKEAWNRYQVEEWRKGIHGEPLYHKVYWLRDNVLKVIFREWYAIHNAKNPAAFDHKFTYKEFKRLLKLYGKTNKQIAEEIYEFCSNDYHKGNNLTFHQRKEYPLYDKFKPEFYGYYADYDWVVFCWLFGKMIDLPKGFPMYCIDLKQTIDELGKKLKPQGSLLTYQEFIEGRKNYPKQINEHNALADARWTYELYKFLNTL